MSGTRIAVVEDEADLREVMVEYLRTQGFDPEPCPDGAALDAALARGPVEAVLLDLNLPREGGLSIARRLRALSPAPAILMVTSLGESTDRVVGLELGADDYIGKPFELRELLARLRTVLRGHRAAAAATPVQAARSATEYRFDGFRLLPDQRRLLDEAGRDVALTPSEFDLLDVLANAPNQVLTREQLLRLPTGQPADPYDRSIDIRVTRLRRKLERDPANPRLIRTVRGQGYQFCPDG
ncbi:winged helix-turn-helix domain-containing protein [Falsiroseomonas sp. HW251]|uniref:winged helix-turn-helix domain-containing protein n=1 Tax=Falsiroseomonas sp. HW251 TaxID=3390998 RepID=UPI003D310C52